MNELTDFKLGTIVEYNGVRGEVKDIKKQLHELVDNLDIDRFNLACYSDGKIATTRTLEQYLVELLSEYQKPKELTLEDKLINFGFNFERDNIYRKLNTYVIIYDTYVKVLQPFKGIYDCSLVSSKNNSEQIFKNIEFLQSTYE